MRKGHSSSSVGLCGLFFCPVCQTSLAFAAPLKLSPGSISYISNTCEGYSTTISNTPGLSECDHALIGLSFLSSLTTN